VDVTVIPMDRERALPHQTVVVREDRIAAVGDAKRVRPPAGALRVDGRGKFLIPGLADMHAHPDTTGDLLLFVANGVTMIRNMFGEPKHLRWREQIARGELLGPTIYTAGPILDGPDPSAPGMVVADTPERAEQLVVAQHDSGYDFIKVYNKLSAPVYERIVATARRVGMPVAGHVPLSVGIRGALAARQASVEHLRGYAAELVRDDAPVHPGSDFSYRARAVAWNYVDESRFAAVARATAAAGVWNCPTLIVEKVALLPADEYAAYQRRPEMRFVPRAEREVSRDSVPGMKEFREEDYVAAQRAVAVKQRFVKALHDAGARLLAGTDFPPWGFTLYDELELLAGAGLTPYEALRAATHDAAESPSAARP
jgi:imidazolonepropionase-like amidohydrolase